MLLRAESPPIVTFCGPAATGSDTVPLLFRTPAPPNWLSLPEVKTPGLLKVLVAAPNSTGPAMRPVLSITADPPEVCRLAEPPAMIPAFSTVAPEPEVSDTAVRAPLTVAAEPTTRSEFVAALTTMVAGEESDLVTVAPVTDTLAAPFLLWAMIAEPESVEALPLDTLSAPAPNAPIA